MTDPRAALTRLRAEKQARVDVLTAELAEVVAATAGSNLDDEHDPEGATVAFEREQVAALRDQVRRDIDEIDAALVRVAAGTYGRCADCGGAIAAERLTARPAVTTCVSCAARRR